MLDEEFKKQRARTVRDLAEKANDPFIKRRLLDLVSRYEDDGRRATPLTPVDLEFASQSTGSATTPEPRSSTNVPESQVLACFDP
jgi:hypothetical protein